MDRIISSQKKAFMELACFLQSVMKCFLSGMCQVSENVPEPLGISYKTLVPLCQFQEMIKSSHQHQNDLRPMLFNVPPKIQLLLSHQKWPRFQSSQHTVTKVLSS